MKFLHDVPPFVFFTGKGGVGKTSLACSTAVRLASQGKRVLLVSTDPASNIGQVFGVSIGHVITRIEAVPGLSALEIDPQAAAQQYRDRIVGPVRGVLPAAVVSGIEEQLSGACTTEIAAFDEFTALLTDAKLIVGYDHILFDTAPTGHTIRLLQLPGAWTGFLDKSSEGASCLGPLSGLEKQRGQYKDAVVALADATRTRLVLVARAQRSTLNEASRTCEELNEIGLTNQYLVINAIMPASEATGDPLAAAVVAREKAALDAIPGPLSALPTDHLPLKSFNLVGLNALKNFFSDDGAPTSGMSGAATEFDASGLSSLVDGMVGSGHGLIMLMGKGGVGKTTLAAAIAVELAHRGHDVHLTTSDPAAHLTETLEGAHERLTVSRIDPHVETELYRKHVLDTKGKDLDAQGRALLEEDLRSPCTEEIAVFQAFSRIVREAGKRFVVMDTAPTGHILLLLDATGAYHREVSRQAHGAGRVTTPMMRLQDPEQTKILLVTLAETTPVLEATALQADLRRAGIEPWAWVVNNSLAAARTRSPLLRQRAANELAQIDAVAKRLAPRYAVVPMQTEEPIGIGQLLRLAEGRRVHSTT